MRDQSPSRTAEAVCFMRAADQLRGPESRILEDPASKLFLSTAARAALAAVGASGKLGEHLWEDLPGLSTYVLARHRFIDDGLVAALARPELEQVVLLGAGYDTRAYRFKEAIKARPIFEVDFPSTSRRKAQIVAEHADHLAPPQDLRIVEIDFASQSIDARLIAAGFKKGAPTFFVWEGVSMYLTRKAVQGTLTQLREISARGSQLAMDYWYLLDSPDLTAAAHRLSANLLHFLGEPITFGIHPEDTPGFIERLGWRVRDLAEAQELERRYVRDGRKVYPANFVLLCETV